MDLTTPLRKSALLREAEQRGCLVVDPRDIFLSRLELQTRMITGKQVPREVLEQAVPVLEEE